MKIISWNINGIRSVSKKGFLEWLQEEKPDILGVQEIKAQENQLAKEILAPLNYHAYFNPAERKGYSGTALYSRKQPISVTNGFGIGKYDCEGRAQIADFGDFIFLNIYFPNGKMNNDRLKYKLDFYEDSLKYFEKLKKDGKRLIIAGDYNTAHKEIDLARPKENEDVSGFLPMERKWLDKLVDHGYIDCFRAFNENPNQYTWWSVRSGARKRNVGWRIDYFFCSQNAKSLIKNCYHLPYVLGSDHCPVVLEVN